jgi:hypothetical protein
MKPPLLAIMKYEIQTWKKRPHTQDVHRGITSKGNNIDCVCALGLAAGRMPVCAACQL